MQHSLARNIVMLSVTLAGAAACDSGGLPDPIGPRTTTVILSYVAPTATEPQVISEFPLCVNGVGRTHVRPSWLDFARFDMAAATQVRWDAVLTNVPIGEEVVVRVRDPNTCDSNPTGAATQNVFANGVLLTRVVDTPGNGPGLAFRVAADGTVTP
ncbi:MAG: hypothetical protein ACREON_20455 [Gemmatimonadaceae bacterium]